MCATALGMAAQQVEPEIAIDQVGTISDATALAQERKFDLILLDLGLPDVQGLAGLLMLRRLQPHARIAIVTSSDQPALMRRAAQEASRCPRW